MNSDDFNSDFDLEDFIYDNIPLENKEVSFIASDLVKRVAKSINRPEEIVAEVIREYLKVLIYSEEDEPDFDEYSSYLLFVHLDELDRIELTYSIDSDGDIAVEIGLLSEMPSKKLYS